jgi:phospholipid transport system substrate-binding protein
VSRRRRHRHNLARLSLFIASFLALASPAPRASPPQLGPHEVIRHLYSELLDVMKHAASLGVKGRYQKLEPLIFGTYDMPFMARLAIGPLWGGLPLEQKYRAAQAYGRYIAAVYASRFDGYAGERFEVLGEQKLVHGMLVRSQIIKSDGEPVTLNYRVHDNVVGWQIRDVYETGTISELATQRSDFARILRMGGIEGLIASLNKKADDLLDLKPASSCATLHPPDARPDDPIRHAQWGGAVRGGRAQHVTGDGADARDRGEHRFGPVVDGFLMEVDNTAGVRQVIRHERDAACRQRRVVPRFRQLVVGPAADDMAAQAVVAELGGGPEGSIHLVRASGLR